jgi:hypothetical protein
MPAGYARVRVDEIMEGFGGLELEIPIGEGETTLGELMRGSIIIEKGNHRVFRLGAKDPDSSKTTDSSKSTDSSEGP